MPQERKGAIPPGKRIRPEANEEPSVVVLYVLVAGIICALAGLLVLIFSGPDIVALLPEGVSQFLGELLRPASKHGAG